MEKIPAQISFKAKVKTIINADDSTEPYIEYKRKVSRSDCNLKPHLHAYYNCDMFPSMLQRAYQEAINNREWIRLSQLPSYDGKFWFFHHDHATAHGGVNVIAPCRVFQQIA